jgi:hypothetical protein
MTGPKTGGRSVSVRGPEINKEDLKVSRFGQLFVFVILNIVRHGELR